MSGNWTPGPWTFRTDPATGDCGFVAPGTGCFIEAYADIRKAHEFARDEAIANAHLIAAAPCLHEALVDVLRSASKDFPPGVKGTTQFEDAYREAFAALRKARGEK